MKKRYYLLAALATVLFACNKDVTLLTPDEVGKVAVVDDTNPAKEDEGDPEEATDPVETTDPVENTEVGDATEDLVPILLGTSFNLDVATTRTESTTYQATELIDANTVGVYIYKYNEMTTNTTDKYGYVNLAYTASNSTGDLSLVSGQRQPYFPADKTQKIDIYAFAPRAQILTNQTSADELTNETEVSFSVQPDQSTDANYQKSDFIWGSNTNNVTAQAYKEATSTAGSYVVGADKKVLVPMAHKGSKIIVNLREGYSMGGKLAGASVTINNVKLGGNVNLQSGEMEATGSATSLTLSSSLATALSTAVFTDSQTYTDDESIHKFYSTAGIIYPQSSVSKSSFITITLSSTNGSTAYNCTIDGSGTQTFEGSKVYTYNITVNATGISLTTSINDWTSAGTAVSGNATF